jgi:DNA helicase II / ATP-dependent DNA helicase PcrA
MTNMDEFQKEYNKLNPLQKEAVDSIEGPVMVVAGPGTGKTQILALRIGNILQKTDTEANGILCLTFTNSGVRAMQNRLEEYIGIDAHKVCISTFHSFAMDLVSNNYEFLDFEMMPKLLEDDEAIILIDEILQNNEWEYLRPRNNSGMYFNDLKQLISILKRERLTPVEFLAYIEKDIEFLENDPDSISSRGESKGKIKKEIEKKIEALNRTKEVVAFYTIYEEKKKEMCLIDYDDILEYAVKLVENFEDIRADIYENYQYVLVDEHQDSSGVQNKFLKTVWGEVENPNIFVVGDDRQLIYAFSGAKLSYFEEFAHFFGKAKLITLVENYRSSTNILEIADDLLKSSISKGKLNSNTKGANKILLNEYSYQRDEIIGAGLYFQDKIKNGVPPEDCALLVPKNFHVRSAVQILSDLNLPVSSGKNLSLFNIKEAQDLLLILKIINDPFNNVYLAESILTKKSGVRVLEAHKFLKNNKILSIEDFIKNGKDGGLFISEDSIAKWGKVLQNWVELGGERVSLIVSKIGNEFLIDNSVSHEELLRNVEIVRSLIHIAMLFEQKHRNASLADFLFYLNRLEEYGSNISISTFGENKGIQVMTLHKSKGLEYQNVWIAHMNEEVIMSEKKNGFTLPEKIKEHITERSVENAKRELYVAITRAKENCIISYASTGYNGQDMNLAQIISELPDAHFIKKDKTDTEKEILENKMGPKIFTQAKDIVEGNIKEDIKSFVEENYKNTKVTVTLLNNFFECPWKWYFRNFLKLPEVKGVSLALGSAVHSTIEFILKSKNLPKVTEIKDKIHTELNKEGVRDTTEIQRIEKEAFNIIENWIENHYKNLKDDYSSERSVSFRDVNFKDLLMYGKLDLTEREGSEIIITDFKTGKSKTANEIEKIDEDGRLSTSMRQLAMYSYLILGAENKKVSISKLLFLEAKKGDKNAVYSTCINEEQIELLKKDINDYVKSLQSGEWMNAKCNYKSWGSNKDECEYCELAKRII